MTPERLLVYYEKIADAPDAIARLRRFVLDLAVRGKLVPQDPDDEPASELLKRIAAEKARLAKAGEIRKEKLLPPVEDEAEFEVPKSWQWTRLGIVASYIQRGKTPKYSASDGSPVISQKSVQWSGLDLSVAKKITFESLADYEPIRFLRHGDLLWNSTGTGTIGRVIRLENPPEKLVCDSHVTVVRCLEVDPEYIRTWLRSDYVYARIEDRAAGSTNQVELTAQMAINQVVPLPPLAEQHRIVAKVNELMALMDRLEAARTERESTRDKLTTASLARLNRPDPATIRDDARFALDSLPALTARPDQIRHLRQTILNLAVRGKLVPQDPNDEPASELLKRIAKTRGASGKRQKELPEINADELGELPPGWYAAPLIALGDWAIGSGFPKNEQGEADGPYFFLKVSDMNLPGNEKFITVANNFIDDAAAKRMRAAIHPPGTIIFPKIGGAIATNKRRILTRGSAIDNNCLGITFSSNIDTEWAYLLMTTLDFTRYQAGTAVPALQQGTLASIPVAVPPLAEQRRIVAKVDELMALCDRLEASLATADDTRRRLLEALLAEALAPADACELEAAE